MAYGEKVCACCGSRDGIEEHHLYLRVDGCPDDLTVYLCHTCHGRAHGMSKRVNMSKAIAKGLERVRAQGIKLGRKPLAVTHPQAVVLAKQLRRKKPKGGQMSLRAIAVELAAAGHVNERGAPFNPRAVLEMVNS